MNLIEVESVGKRYRTRTGGQPRTVRRLVDWEPRREHWALRDVTFSVARAEAVGLIGANGSGKSTLLRLLAGLSRPTLGRISVRGEVSGLLTIGDGLQPILTGEENVITGAILAGLTRRQARQRLESVTAFAELEGHMDQPLRTFSDGMRLRLAFSTAIHVEPEILLIDEILAVGDLRFQEKCLDRLEEMRGQGVTVVVASHDLVTIERLCERCVWLADGKTVSIGHVTEVVALYEQAMRSTGTAAPTQQGPKLRLGSGEVEITGVRLLDGYGEPTGGIAAGGPLTVEISFDAHERVDEAIFSVSVNSDHEGLRCLDINTRGDGRTVGPLHGTGTISLHLQRVDLSGGGYQVSVGAYPPDWSQAYDYLWQAVALKVVASGSSGLLEPPHGWTVGSAAEAGEAATAGTDPASSEVGRR